MATIPSSVPVAINEQHLSFGAPIANQVRLRNMLDEPPASIIMLTDGFAEWPDEEMAHGIPVLWLINNEKVDPPWGRVARMKV